ncbi:MAG: Stk1 family PASTA domain-containing Ser/Thr kinase [Chloroflexi bacterium]|nr:Stk1 family PASTA domain-containing Ser/Thr kinase [Chloroflexota bacterium]
MDPMLLNNRYRLLEMVGSGGMAVVYRGVDALLHRRVAVKVLRESYAGDPAFLARFRREAQAAANLDHANIVTVYDVGQEGDRHYIVMEYVDGQDLKTLIRQSGQLSVEQALNIGVQICAGVGHAHRAGLIHCDIKPQNVLIAPDGHAKVTDFGISRALSETGLTESETVWGSPLYFSPEQAAGEPPSPASDVYSIGVVLYEMLAGVPPFQAEKATALALMHMREEPPALALRNTQVPPQLEWVIRKVLTKEPSARYRTAEQLAHVLEEYRRHGEQRTGTQPALAGAPIQLASTATPRPSTPKPHPLHTPERASPSAPPGAPKPLAERGFFEPEFTPNVPLKPTNGLTWLLGAIAAIAVLGLIPLWTVVYRTYAAADAPSSATPSVAPTTTVTEEAQMIAVPVVSGRTLEEAERILESTNLYSRVQIEESLDEEEGVVLAQTPSPGTSVHRDTEVVLIVVGSRRELTMPPVIGYSIEVVEDGLRSDGLRVVTDEIWSSQARGIVLDQEPAPSTTIQAGDVVTLTLSGGTTVPIEIGANLDGWAILDSVELRQRRFRPGDVIPLTIRWRALKRTDTRFTVFVHLIGPDGRLAAQQDTEPIVSTTDWIPDIDVMDPHQVRIPSDQAPGIYQLRVGMYPQGQPGSRVPVVGSGTTSADSDSILIREVEITVQD